MADNYRDREIKMRKGQAFNLAVQTALADDKGGDNEYIIKQFLRYYNFASFVQSASPEDLAAAVKSEKMLLALKELDRAIKE